MSRHALDAPSGSDARRVLMISARHRIFFPFAPVVLAGANARASSVAAE
jgi:hypothetical protein